MNRYLILLTLSIALLLNSCDPCTKKAQCPAFEGAILLGWFPYHEGDQYRFADMGGDIDTLNIVTVKKTDAYEVTYRTGTNGKEPTCDIKGSIGGPKRDTTRPHLLGFYAEQVEAALSGYEEWVYFAFRYTDIMYVRVDSTGKTTVSGDGFYGIEQENVEVHGVSYKHVITITPVDTAKASLRNMDKVYLVKGKGIVGYRTYPEQKEYWLQ